MNDIPKQKGGTDAIITRFHAIIVIVAALAIGYFVYSTTVDEGSKYPFKLGLDLAGGSHLVYEADTSGIDPAEVPELMNVLREVIERRVNAFGVSEPIVQVEHSSAVAETKIERLIVELPGITDVKEAEKEIGKTPLLEFKLVDTAKAEAQASIEQAIAAARADGKEIDPSAFGLEDAYIDTGLTGRYLKTAEVVLGQGNGARLSNEPIVSITFSDEGAALFEQITSEHVGEQLAIFLDGNLMSAPTINEAIGGGRAIISGNFTLDEARELVQNLNFGALPVPIALASTQTIGSSLGAEALHAGVYAGVVGFVILIAFMILWYRLPGVIAAVALVIYVIIMLALFKLIPVVLTAAGIAGFIISVGLAVDANILISERIKEELRAGKEIEDAIVAGFDRAWLAIRDSNITHIIVGIILFWFGTALIKGFAFVLVLGVFVSMLSAITISRTLLRALPSLRKSAVAEFLFSTGFSKK